MTLLALFNDLFAKPEPSAWRRMQSHFAKLETSPVTQTKGKARKDREAIVHAALAGRKAG